MLGLANIYKCRPSSFLGIEDAYTAFCFDEACAYISYMIETKEETPTFRKEYKSFKDIYAQYENRK